MTRDQEMLPPIVRPHDDSSAISPMMHLHPIGDGGVGSAQHRLALKPWVMVLILIIMAALIYSNTFQVPFVFDDLPNISENPHIRLIRFNLEGIVDAGFNSPLPRRPVANVSFALNYLFHHFEVAGYHLVNIAVHMGSGVILFFLLRAMLQLAGPGGMLKTETNASNGAVDAASSVPGNDSVTLFAFWVTALWMVHPVHTQTVTYIVQRMNGLATMFTLMALYGYTRARTAPKGWKRRALVVLCGLATVLALGSKENAVTLPFFIFLYEWYFFQDVSGAWIRKQIPLILLLALSGILIAYFFLGTSPVAQILAGYQIRDFTPSQRVLTQLRVVCFYISLLLFPHPSRLNLDHQYPLSYSLTDPATTLAAGLFVWGMLGVAFATARRHKMLSFAILWFFGNLVIESSLIGLELVFEHRTYLPSIAVCGIVTFGIYRLIQHPRIRLVTLLAIVIVCGVWTYTRNATWQSDLSLWADSAAKSPDKARPQNNLGNALRRQGRIAEAEAHYRKALYLLPGYFEAHNNLGVILTESGRTAEAMVHFRLALKSNPVFFMAHRNLAGVLIQTGETDAAMDHLKKALALKPSDAESHYLLGNIHMDRGNHTVALSHYFRALTADPDHAGAHTNAGIIIASAGRIAEAIPHFQAAVRQTPDDPQARANLARALNDLSAGSGL